MTDLPQIWELSALILAEQRAEDTEQLRTAMLLEHAAVTMADRLRGATGRHVQIDGSDGSTVAGVVELVGCDAAVITAAGRCWVVPLLSAAGFRIADLPPAVPPRGMERLGWRALLRRLVDRTVVVSAVGGQEVAGRLVAVAADHLVVGNGGGIRLVPAASLWRVGWRVGAADDGPFGG